MRPCESEIVGLQEDREVLRTKLLEHPLFSQLKDLDDLRCFMESHVFAVWDFMSLARRLQRDLACLDVPWLPPVDPLAARLINEIVLAEESDHDGRGGYASHFSIYLEAMDEIGAKTGPMRQFLTTIGMDTDFEGMLVQSKLPQHVEGFLRATLRTAIQGKLEEVLGYFFFGREELIPHLFETLLIRWGLHPDRVPRLTYYLERHIQLDKDEHGPAVSRLVNRMVHGKPELEISLLQASCHALTQRIALWDGVLAEIERRRYHQRDIGETC